MRLSLADYERDAAGILSPMVHGYYAGGAEDEDTLRENRDAFARLRLLPRALRGVGSRTTQTMVLGTPVEAPVLVAPMAFQRLAHPEGEVATARGAGGAGTVMITSTLATTPLEEVAAAASHPLWFQLYVYSDRDVTRRLVARARDAGYKALVLTVDTPVLGSREREARTGFRMPTGLSIRNLEGAGHDGMPGEDGESGLARYAHRLLDPDLSWEDVAWLREISGMPVVVKGVVHPDDARCAVEAGAAAIVVSNHGGRQMDGAAATIEALPGVMDAVRGEAIEVYLDGGVRRGVDVLRALALGAHAVLLGRPVLWGLALEGSEGVRRVLEILTGEFDRALALAGICSPEELREDGGRLILGRTHR
jgi:4-hydroxymandelate oxidase